MRKCHQCGQVFEPDPRVADRQVTCGDEICRRRQHAEACRRWRQQNRDATSYHYEDTVVPFRKRRRTYQREWRFLRSLCKIRDAIAPTILDIGGPLSRLSSRGESILAVRAIDEHGAKHLGEQDQFVDAVRIARRISIGVEELASLIRQLERMDKP